jgi:energy-coupling factor transporter transmembrane protein EcfT
MSKANVKHNQKLEPVPGSEWNRKLDAIGWGLFFIWMGATLFAHLGWGVGLLGVGMITLGVQAARKYFELKLEGFWVVMGFFFVLGGVWKFFNVPFDLLQYCAWR